MKPSIIRLRALEKQLYAYLYAMTVIDFDAETVAPILLEAFKALGGALPQAWSAHRWRYAITDSAVDGGCVWHAADGLGLCGDWLNGGRVEGAWLSGRAVAEQVRSSFIAEAR